MKGCIGVRRSANPESPTPNSKPEKLTRRPLDETFGLTSQAFEHSERLLDVPIHRELAGEIETPLLCGLPPIRFGPIFYCLSDRTGIVWSINNLAVNARFNNLCETI
jgi:hypothetical protein